MEMTEEGGRGREGIVLPVDEGIGEEIGDVDEGGQGPYEEGDEAGGTQGELLAGGVDDVHELVDCNCS